MEEQMESELIGVISEYLNQGAIPELMHLYSFYVDKKWGTNRLRRTAISDLVDVRAE